MFVVSLAWFQRSLALRGLAREADFPVQPSVTAAAATKVAAAAPSTLSEREKAAPIVQNLALLENHRLFFLGQQVTGVRCLLVG